MYDMYALLRGLLGKTTVGPSEEVVRGSLAEQSSKWKIPHPSNGCLSPQTGSPLRMEELSSAVSHSFWLPRSEFSFMKLFSSLHTPFHSPDRDFSSLYKQVGGNWSDCDFPLLFCFYAPILSLHLSLRRHLRDLYLSVLPHTFQWIYTSFHGIVYKQRLIIKTAHLHGSMHLRNKMGHYLWPGFSCPTLFMPPSTGHIEMWIVLEELA